MNATQRFLRAEVKLMRKVRQRRLNGWFSTGHFVLTHGREWTTKTDVPKEARDRKLGQCFRNAANLALGWYRNELIYCEGYAISVIPMMHAWCIDLQGRIIDPTGNQWTDYFGLAFKSMYLQEALQSQGHYGLIDAWKSDWPLLRTKPEEWRHPVMDA